MGCLVIKLIKHPTDSLSEIIQEREREIPGSNWNLQSPYASGQTWIHDASSYLCLKRRKHKTIWKQKAVLYVIWVSFALPSFLFKRRKAALAGALAVAECICHLWFFACTCFILLLPNVLSDIFFVVGRDILLKNSKRHKSIQRYDWNSQLLSKTKAWETGTDVWS